MSLRILIIYISLGLLTLGMYGCDYNHIKSSEVSSQQVSFEKLTTPDYKTVESLVIAPRCYSCHTEATGKKGGLDLLGYKNVRQSLSRLAFRSLEKQDMPPKQILSEREQAILRRWIDSGAPVDVLPNADKVDPSLESGPIGWEKIRGKIFVTKCLDCHSPPNPQGDLDLTSLLATRLKAKELFERIIIKQDMPLAPYLALTPSERRAVLKWFDSGMPE